MGGGRRLRHPLSLSLVAVLLLVAGAVAYAVWPRHASPHARAETRVVGLPAGGASAVTPAPAPTSPRAKATPTTRKPSATPAPKGTEAVAPLPRSTTNREGFKSVVTNAIPPPTYTVGINDPVPGMTNMQPAARSAFTAAFTALRTAGYAPTIASAWRSAAWQQVLFDRAVARYGSATEAAKWVLRPLQSAHVKGYAIDVHPQSAAAWLQSHGAAYGICRIYANEWWHFEYRATRTCPPLDPNASG